jgi:spermidine synthase
LPVTPQVVARIETARGELVLRKDGEHFEVISNGVFLMDTRDGRSERLLVNAALEAHPAPRSLLIGGLGVGFSLGAAVEVQGLERITVVEIEPVLVEWYERELKGTAHHDPRVSVVIGDVAEHAGRYDVVCLDVDNGPDWTVADANTSLYDETGTAALAGRLTTGGVLAVWSAHAVPSYEAVLRRHFSDVHVFSVDVARGEPDVVYVAKANRDEGVR